MTPHSGSEHLSTGSVGASTRCGDSASPLLTQNRPLTLQGPPPIGFFFFSMRVLGVRVEVPEEGGGRLAGKQAAAEVWLGTSIAQV